MIVAGMATLPERLNTLDLVISRLHPQVDIIELALNDYSKIPNILSKYPKVNPTLTSNLMGDANKFHNVSKYPNSYYFSVDDDILYPENYIQTYIKEIDKNKCLITVHGSKIPPRNIQSYYKGRSMKSHCLNSCEEVTVHIPGSGVSGFHTSFLKINYPEGFKAANMADIFLGIQCQQQKVRCLAIKHEKGWIRGGLNEGRKTIWDTHKNNDSIQTKFINSIVWRDF
jgi:hypothetical protein